MRFTSWRWPATHWSAVRNASSNKHADTVAAPATRSAASAACLRTGSDLLTDRQRQRLTAVVATEQHVEVEATWAVCQRSVAAYRNHDRAAAKAKLKRIIATITAALPTVLTELITHGRTLKRRAADVLAYFDRAGTRNGPTGAINGRLEHLRGSALGFRNLTNYIARSLLEAGCFKPPRHRQCG